VFTVYGMIGFVWVALWSVLVSERPSHRQVAALQDNDSSDAPVRIPYRAFATCLPLWAIITVETTHGEPHALQNAAVFGSALSQRYQWLHHPQHEENVPRSLQCLNKPLCMHWVTDIQQDVDMCAGCCANGFWAWQHIAYIPQCVLRKCFLCLQY